MSGVRSVNLDEAVIVDEVLGNREGSTVRIAVTRLLALLAARLGPTYATRAALYADLTWPDGAQGYVRGDATPAFNGYYRKDGAAEAGGWTRIGDLPTGAVEAAQLAALEDAVALLAPLVDAALTGVPTAPTAALGTNSAQIATTAHVKAALVALIGDAPDTLDTLHKLASAIGNDAAFASTISTVLAAKADDVDLQAEIAARAAHAALANNPHGVTKAQIGLDNVDNTADADKPVSTAQVELLAQKASQADLTGEVARALEAEAQTAPGQRPGEFARAYGPNLTGNFAATAPYSSADVMTGDEFGAALLLKVATLVALRQPVPIEPGRVYQARYAVKRSVNPSDPLGDAVELGVRWLTGTHGGVAGGSGNRIIDTMPLSVEMGLQWRVSTLSVDVAGADFAIPASARYGRPWVRTYGNDHETLIALVSLRDITEAWLADRDAQAGLAAHDATLALKAPLVSPALTGTPTAPTAETTMVSTQIATTAFTHSVAIAAIDALVAAAPSEMDTLQKLASALGDDPNFAATAAKTAASAASGVTGGMRFQTLAGAPKGLVITNEVGAIGAEFDDAGNPVFAMTSAFIGLGRPNLGGVDIVDGDGFPVLALDRFGNPVQQSQPAFSSVASPNFGGVSFTDRNDRLIFETDEIGNPAMRAREAFHKVPAMPIEDLLFADSNGYHLDLGGGDESPDYGALAQSQPIGDTGTAVLWRDGRHLAVRPALTDLYTTPRSGWFTNLATLYARYDALVAVFPEYVTKSSLGVDGLGNHIYQYIFAPKVPKLSAPGLGAGLTEAEVAPPKIILSSGLHGSERTAQMGNLIFANQLCYGWRDSAEYRRLRFGARMAS